MQTDQKKTKTSDVYEIVTNRIIEHLEKGVIPWKQPWTDSGPPRNLITGRNYRGINLWLLNTLKYPQNCFLTYKQVQEMGATVKKGEKACPVIFWKWIEKNNPKERTNQKEQEETQRVPMLRYYNVFNVDQCEGIPKEKIPIIEEKKNNPIKECERIVFEMPRRPEIKHHELQSFYHKGQDFVNMPRMEVFNSSEDYYVTLFHELVHSTGHVERLGRKELMNSKGFKTEDYAIEELTAEMGASYLQSYAGIPINHLENNASYIQSWLEKLKNDRKFIVYAASHAQRATDYILNVKSEEREIENGENTIKIEELEEVRKSEKKYSRGR